MVTAQTTTGMATKFYYFGFGSNMLAQRLHIQNPSAVLVGPGRLENYRLDFNTIAKRWQGSPATIVPTKGDCVWGAIWEIDCCHMKDLDNQEGVHIGIYKPLTVPVYASKQNKMIECRAYHLSKQPETNLKSLTKENIPEDRQPSFTYLKTIVKGAIESQLPEDYVQWLRHIKHNSQKVQSFEEQLNLEGFVM